MDDNTFPSRYFALQLLVNVLKSDVAEQCVADLL